MVLQEIRMNLLKRLLLVVIASTGVIGSAQAQTPGNIFNLGTLTPIVTTTTDTSLVSTGSFLDTFNFTLDATHHMVTGTTNSTNLGNLQLGLYDSTGALLYTGLNFKTDLAPSASYYAKIWGDVITSPGKLTFSVAANPEPAEWMLLLCGFVVAGFIARRKMSLVAG
jgi:hypothetical protein